MPPDPRNFLPLKPVDLELLLALADQDLHGYGLVQAIAEHTDGLFVLDPGNLYRVIKRLLADGLIAESDRDGGEAGSGEVLPHHAARRARARERTRSAASPRFCIRDASVRQAVDLMILFNLLLRLFPRAFRDAFGDEMRRLFVGPAARGRQTEGARATAPSCGCGRSPA